VNIPELMVWAYNRKWQLAKAKQKIKTFQADGILW
jgi:hypothetical protein